MSYYKNSFEDCISSISKSVLKSIVFLDWKISLVYVVNLYHSTTEWYIQKGRPKGVNAIRESHLCSCTSNHNVVKPHGLLFNRLEISEMYPLCAIAPLQTLTFYPFDFCLVNKKPQIPWPFALLDIWLKNEELKLPPGFVIFPYLMYSVEGALTYE